jgi:hypothetical protein
MKKITFIAAPILLLLFSFIPKTGSAKEAYWEKYHIDVSGLKDEQVQVLETTIDQLRTLKSSGLKINKKVYRRLSRFKELFEFPFGGQELSRWLLTRMKSISYRNTWTAAVNENMGDFVLGDFFFKKMTTIERFYSLIHEARHSDGDGYPHIKCPKGFKYISSRQPNMDLESEPTCDNNDKGAYAFQAAFLFELFAYGLFDQEKMGLLYNSSISRLVR